MMSSWCGSLKVTVLLNLAVDPTKKGTLAYDELYKGLTSIIPLTHQEVYALFRHCKVDKDSNLLSMKALWKVMGGS
jgi:hypothetical protein